MKQSVLVFEVAHVMIKVLMFEKQIEIYFQIITVKMRELFNVNEF